MKVDERFGASIKNRNEKENKELQGDWKIQSEHY